MPGGIHYRPVLHNRACGSKGLPLATPGQARQLLGASGMAVPEASPFAARNQPAGKYTVNVEPWPSSDCTTMRPPAFSTILFTM